MAFYAPQSRQQQAQAFRAAFLQADGLPLDDVLTADDVVSAGEVFAPMPAPTATAPPPPSSPRC